MLQSTYKPRVWILVLDIGFNQQGWNRSNGRRFSGSIPFGASQTTNNSLDVPQLKHIQSCLSTLDEQVRSS
eukprot:2310083-Amphidinium_carterae.1